MSEYIFVTNIFEYSNIRIYSSHSGLDCRNLTQYPTALVVESARPGHCPVARWRRVPGVSPVQPGTLQAPLVSPDQWRRSQQVRYLPLNIRVCTVSFLTSSPLPKQEVRRLDGALRDMWEERRCEREERDEASVRNLNPQKLATMLEHELFH